MSDSLVTPWKVACQAPLSMGFPRQEYWSGLPFPSPGDLPNTGIELESPALAGRFFILSHQGSLMLGIIGIIFLDKEGKNGRSSGNLVDFVLHILYDLLY